jgi:prolipoprotein diacylglyceryl transferase
MAHPAGALPQYIPSPPINGFHVGPLVIRFYALGYIIGITLAILITRKRWRALGGDPGLVNDIALWVVPAGIIGGRIYFDVTTPMDMPRVWYGPFAVWTGGLGIWGGVALAAIVGVWRLRRLGITAGAFANTIAPALLVAQAIGRIGNYFNKELFGKPTTLPWGLEIPYQYRVSGGIPAQDLRFATFQPTFLYELIWDLALAALLVWLGHHAKIKPWGLFALYVAGYSAFRIFEESVRIDSSEYILGLRLNLYIAIIVTLAGITWFVLAQRRPDRPVVVLPGTDSPARAAGQNFAEQSVPGRLPHLPVEPGGDESHANRDRTSLYPYTSGERAPCWPGIPFATCQPHDTIRLTRAGRADDET